MVPPGSRHVGVVLALLAALLVAGAGAGAVQSPRAIEPLQPPRKDGASLPRTDDAASRTRCPAPPGETIEPAYDGRDNGLLVANRDVVEAYGRSHRTEFGGYQFAAGSPSRLRVAFTDHLAQHAAALHTMVPFPERLDVVRSVHTVAELQSIMESLATDLSRPDRKDVLTSLSVGWQAVDVGMNAGLEELARRYAERFGSGVRITLGGHAYLPVACGGRVDAVRCADLVGADPSAAKLTLVLVADTTSIAAAQTGRARLVVHNLGSRRFVIDSGIPIVGSLVLPGTDRVVGRWSGTSAGVGGGVDLEPGEAGEIAVVFGASRCDGQPGSALPPGRYGLRVTLAPEGGGEPSFVSPEAIVAVTANPAPAL